MFAFFTFCGIVAVTFGFPENATSIAVDIFVPYQEFRKQSFLIKEFI